MCSAIVHTVRNLRSVQEPQPRSELMLRPPELPAALITIALSPELINIYTRNRGLERSGRKQTSPNLPLVRIACLQVAAGSSMSDDPPSPGHVTPHATSAILFLSEHAHTHTST